MAKFSLDYSQLGGLIDKYTKLGGNVKKIATECLEFIPEEINPELKAEMRKHKRTGKTEKSIEDNPKVEWNSLVASIDVGFNLKKGGFPSIFLMYGTPKHTPLNQYGSPKRASARMNPGITQDKALHDAIYGDKIQKKILDKQKEIFNKAIEEAMKG